MAQFVVDVREWIKDAHVKVNTVHKKVAFLGYAKLTNKTRVDTGRARASWRVALNHMDDTNEPDRGAYKSKYKGPGSIVPIDTNEQAYAANQLKALKRDDVVYVSNTVPYIEILEGKDHMLQLTVEELIREMEGIIRDTANEKGEVPGTLGGVQVSILPGGVATTAQQAVQSALRTRAGGRTLTFEEEQKIIKGARLAHSFAVRRAVGGRRGG